MEEDAVPNNQMFNLNAKNPDLLRKETPIFRKDNPNGPNGIKPIDYDKLFEELPPPIQIKEVEPEKEGE